MRLNILSFLTDIFLQHEAKFPSFRKIGRMANKYFSPKTDIKIRVQDFDMYASTLDRLLALFLWKFSYLEGFEKKIVERVVKHGMTVFDIGANIGFYSLSLAKLVGERGRVYAFEPDPENYRLLSKNIKANNFNNIIPVKKALSNKEGKVKFFLSEEHRGDHRLYNPGDYRKVINIDSITLDGFTAKKKIKTNFIKMDIQGAEYLAYLGMEKTVKNAKKIVIMCEFTPTAIIKSGHSPRRFIDELRKSGFSVNIMDSKTKKVRKVSTISLMKICSNGKYTNLLLVKGNQSFVNE